MLKYELLWQRIVDYDFTESNKNKILLITHPKVIEILTSSRNNINPC